MQLLEEIGASKPSFPVQKIFSRFLKRHKDSLQAAVAGKNVLLLGLVSF